MSAINWRAGLYGARGGGGGGAWGAITGTLSSQTDLNTALSEKVTTSTTVNGHALTSNINLTANDVNAQSSLVSGTSIKTVNGSSLLGPGDLTINGGNGNITPNTILMSSTPSVLGTIIDDNFTGSTLNATNWTAINSPALSVNNGITVSSGSKLWDKFIRYEKYFPFEKFNIELSFVATSKASGNAIGFRTNSTMANNNYDGFIKFNLFTGQLSAGVDTSTNTYIGQSLAFSTGDQLKFSIKRIYDIYEITANNLTTGNIAKLTFNYALRGSGGRFAFVPLGGTQTISEFKVSSDVKQNPFCSIIGNSISLASYLSIDRRYANLLFNSDYNRFEVHAANGIFSSTVAGWINEVTQLHPTYAIINIGVNDNNTAVSSSVYNTNLTAIVSALQAVGTVVILTTLTPQPVGNIANFNTEIQNVATSKSCKVVDLYSILKNKTTTVLADTFYLDGVHPNSDGQSLIASIIRTKCPELYQSIYTSNTNISNPLLPVGKENDQLVTVDYKGNFNKMPAYRMLDASYIVNNKSNVHSRGKIWIDQSIRCDSDFQQSNHLGLLIGFNGSTGNNIEITDNGSTGIGFPQKYGVRGSNNLHIGATTKNGYNFAWTGSGNVGVGFNALATLTTGSNNICFAQNAGLTTGSNNTFMGSVVSSTLTTCSDNIVIGNPSDGFSGNTSNRIAIGRFSSSIGYAGLNQYDISISAGGGSSTLYFGGVSQYLSRSYTITTPYNLSGTGDINGGNLILQPAWSHGAGISQIQIKTPNAAASGTLQSVLTTTAYFDRTGLTCNKYSVSALNTAPLSSTDIGITGEIRITASYIYVCTATNTWVRTALSTW